MFYDFSNYGVHERLGDDGITTWYLAFLAFGKSLEECAVKYKGFCQKKDELSGKMFEDELELIP
jgi:putative transposase